MRMDDNLCLPAQADPVSVATTGLLVPKGQRSRRGLRFTSNVVGSLFLLTDVICFIVSAPITMGVYSVIRGSKVLPPIHVTAFILMLGSFLLIRTSRQAYRRSLLDLRDSSDTTFDAVVSSLIASALIWQAGLVRTTRAGFPCCFC